MLPKARPLMLLVKKMKRYNGDGGASRGEEVDLWEWKGMGEYNRRR